MQPNSVQYPRSHRPAFTLVEVLVTISIIAVLASVTVVAIGTIREKADMSTSASNIRQLYVAHQMYLAEAGEFPSGNDTSNILPGASEANCASWVDRIGIYVGIGQDQTETMELIKVGEPPPGILNVAGRKRVVETGGGYRSAYGRSNFIWLNKDQPPGTTFKNLNSFGSLSRSFFLLDAMGISGTVDYSGLIDAKRRLRFPAHGGKPDTLTGSIVVVFMDGHVETVKKRDIPSTATDVFWKPQIN